VEHVAAALNNAVPLLAQGGCILVFVRFSSPMDFDALTLCLQHIRRVNPLLFKDIGLGGVGLLEAGKLREPPAG